MIQETDCVGIPLLPMVEVVVVVVTQNRPDYFSISESGTGYY